jgi:hypothetical protein
MHVARLEVSGVRGFYGERSVNLDFSRPDGSLAGWTVLAGRNSSGKSTLLQALALVLSGPRAASVIPSLADWMSSGVATADMGATLKMSNSDSYQPTLFESNMPHVSMHFERSEQISAPEEYLPEPVFSGIGLDSLMKASMDRTGSPTQDGWFYVGYGPFRHLGSSGLWKSRRSAVSKLALQVSSLFDETVTLADAVDWLIEQRLYMYENRAGAAELIGIVMDFIGDGLLPDGFQVADVDSQGLWVSYHGSRFPLREMGDGYRAVTALVVDIVRQMNAAYRNLKLEYRDNVPTLPYPGIVLIDEVDAHLHVSWQKVIGIWLKQHFPQIQFIVTAHSPYVCQSADPGGLILLPGPGEQRPPYVVDQDLYERVVYGSGDDAVLTELFGIGTPYSAKAETMRRHLGDLEIKILNGSASDREREEHRSLSRTLTSSLSARADMSIRSLADFNEAPSAVRRLG